MGTPPEVARSRSGEHDGRCTETTRGVMRAKQLSEVGPGLTVPVSMGVVRLHGPVQLYATVPQTDWPVISPWSVAGLWFRSEHISVASYW